ncbi:MAG: response regulator [Candidatus Omnitrophota bacterium]
MVKRLIFIVDDEKELRKKYKKLLIKEGFKVVEASNALEVANILMREKSKLDLILLDINISEVDGRDIFDIIEEYVPGLPVIVTSVYPVSEQKLRIPKAVDYYHKLQKEESLIKKIKNALGLE